MFNRMFGRASTAPRQAAPKGAAGLGPSAHVDTFARASLPPAEQWPDLLLDRPEFQYSEYLNAAVELTDRMVEKGFDDHTALIGNGRRRTYKELADWSNRLAHEGDRRATFVRLTPRGAQQFQVMAKAHEAWVNEILAGFSSSDTETLIELLSNLGARSRQVPATEH